MSRIGLKPVIIPESVTITQIEQRLTVAGPKGQLIVDLPSGIKINIETNKMSVTRDTDEGHHRALHGTLRSLINNAVIGVSEGFAKKMEMVGIGYRAAIEDSALVLRVGFTHPVTLQVPEGLEAKVEKNVLTISGIDKQRVGQFSAEIRSTRPPEPYKGKGIRYVGEIIKMKQGKAVKVAG